MSSTSRRFLGGLRDLARVTLELSKDYSLHGN
jgi:hypothetical protein